MGGVKRRFFLICKVDDPSTLDVLRYAETLTRVVYRYASPYTCKHPKLRMRALALLCVFYICVRRLFCS